jgi:hypothetical protein
VTERVGDDPDQEMLAVLAEVEGLSDEEATRLLEGEQADQDSTG